MSLRPPAGAPPPVVAELGDNRLNLVALGREICDRYRVHYPDEARRYGETGQDWCRHDTQWLLSWAVEDAAGLTSLDEQARWLARVLRSRDFPMARLAHNMRIAAEVLGEHLPAPDGAAIGAALQRAATTVDPGRSGAAGSA